MSREYFARFFDGLYNADVQCLSAKGAAAILRTIPELGWFPFEMKPTTETAAILFFPNYFYGQSEYGVDYSVQICRWNGEEWRQQGTNHRIEAASHWMPLPDPPEKEA